ncbi:dCTP deaminase [Kitasatospora phosalacinea]|uniref:Deoxycytidine triphosphate deaminase n=1 Tax=Kitasatospora phosalacinea TaxID=2065 RepID=A0A9W6PPD7_9ACTN|nr:deoxycytidine triphosphate deaminase [Kitasatospora phosalacinea]GLW58731.1 deoxycytidine triphosphate deaminase [Kitasatospora phosalacinea]
MILTGPQIGAEVEEGRITISPFDTSLLSPNSYDFHLSSDIGWYRRRWWGGRTLDCRRPNRFTRSTIPEEGMVLRPGRIYLASTAETIGSEHFVPIIRARSSTARTGLFVHCTADLIDLGSLGRLTLQLHAVQPVRVYPGQRIGQVTFWVPTGRRELYRGKYQGSTLPEPSQIWRDFREEDCRGAAA